MRGQGTCQVRCFSKRCTFLQLGLRQKTGWAHRRSGQSPRLPAGGRARRGACRSGAWFQGSRPRPRRDADGVGGDADPGSRRAPGCGRRRRRRIRGRDRVPGALTAARAAAGDRPPRAISAGRASQSVQRVQRPRTRRSAAAARGGGRHRRLQHGARLHVRGLLRPPAGPGGARERDRLEQLVTDAGQRHESFRRFTARARAQAAGALEKGPGLMDGQPADVLVIGSGASGAAVSLGLAEHGASVVCLEQGDWVDRARLPKRHVDWEVRGRRFWAANPNVRRWPADYPVGSEGDNPVDIYMYNAVGGSTIGFAGNYWRMAPSDFRVRTLDGVGADWPLTYEELAPYYTANEAIVGVAGLAG